LEVGLGCYVGTFPSSQWSNGTTRELRSHCFGKINWSSLTVLCRCPLRVWSLLLDDSDALRFGLRKLRPIRKSIFFVRRCNLLQHDSTPRLDTTIGGEVNQGSFCLSIGYNGSFDSNLARGKAVVALCSGVLHVITTWGTFCLPLKWVFPDNWVWLTRRFCFLPRRFSSSDSVAVLNNAGICGLRNNLLLCRARPIISFSVYIDTGLLMLSVQRASSSSDLLLCTQVVIVINDVFGWRLVVTSPDLAVVSLHIFLPFPLPIHVVFVVYTFMLWILVNLEVHARLHHWVFGAVARRLPWTRDSGATTTRCSLRRITWKQDDIFNPPCGLI